MTRAQFALNVDDIDEVGSCCIALFGIEPTKGRPGYANVTIAEPPLKPVLLENPRRGGTLNQFGVSSEYAARIELRAQPGRDRASGGTRDEAEIEL
jgi:hypothetical protein